MTAGGRVVVGPPAALGAPFLGKGGFPMDVLSAENLVGSGQPLASQAVRGARCAEVQALEIRLGVDDCFLNRTARCTTSHPFVGWEGSSLLE